MKKKTASEILGAVDPHLTVIGGGRRRKHRSNQEDWKDSGGAVCPRCGEERVRFRPEDGNCRECATLLNEKQDQDEKKRANQLRYVKAHNARITRKRG